MEQLRHIEMRYADPEGATLGRTAPFGFLVTSTGLSLLAFLWKVDQFVELPSIRDKYRESWSRLWRLNTKLEKQSLQARETPYTFHNVSRATSLASTQIIFEVIELLHKENQTDIADAIWQSLSCMDWRKGRCPQSVANFPEQLTVEKRNGMFLLDHSQDGFLQQKWLIDRIILQGGFWVGRLVRHSTDHEYSDGVSIEGHEIDATSGDGQADCAPQDQALEDKSCSFAQVYEKLGRGTYRGPLAYQAVDNARESSQGSRLVPVDRSLVPATRLSCTDIYEHGRFKTISDYQLTLSATTKLTENAMMEWDAAEEVFDDPDGRNMLFGTLPLLTTEAVAVCCDSNGRGSSAYLRQQRALFDIEGDISGQVLVLTPFQKRLETIPRPESRSMRVSWVVQPISHVDGSEDQGEPGLFGRRETLKSSGMVRGMWKVMVQPMNRYNLV